jgi:methylglutaconyl-CoA hydratase
MANYTTILVEEKEVDTGRVLTVTLNRPERRNALTSAMVHELTLALRAAEDSRAGVVVLRGAVSSFLLLQVGEKQARDLLLTGRILDAAEARALGLITKVVPAAELDAAVAELTTTLLANSPSSLRATKRLLHHQEIEPLSRNLRAAVNINAELRATDDFREGVAAFLEKRKPVWPSRC